MGRFSSARTCARPLGTGASRVLGCYASGSATGSALRDRLRGYAMSPMSSCAACLPVLAPPSM